MGSKREQNNTPPPITSTIVFAAMRGAIATFSISKCIVVSIYDKVYCRVHAYVYLTFGGGEMSTLAYEDVCKVNGGGGIFGVVSCKLLCIMTKLCKFLFWELIRS